MTAKIVKEEVPADTLDLVVTNKSVGFLETNIEALEVYVKQKLEDYKPENYMGDADLAKKDRAELNKARDKIARARKDLIAELMKPYNDFETRCKALEKMIDSASGSLDEIVKIKENEEKNAKRELINTIWENKKFDLFPLDKVFNPKWLNKTAKLTDIATEIDSIIERTYKDLKTIERFSDDAETLKAHYLIDLNIGDTLDYGEELKKQREVAEREAKERAEREHQEQLSKQKEDVWQEASNLENKQKSENLAMQAIASANNETIKPRQRKEYVVSIRCFEEELIQLKANMNGLGIEFSVEELTF